MATVEKTTTVPAPQSTTVVIVPPHATRREHPPNEKACCCFPVLHDTSSHVKKARRASIFILIVHIVTLLAFLAFLQLGGTVIGIVMSIVLLCKFTKRVYTVAAVLYTIGFISDAANTIFWILFYLAVADDEEDSVDEGWVLGLGVIPCALGAVSFLVGATFTFKAVRDWQHSGATDAMLPA